LGTATEATRRRALFTNRFQSPAVQRSTVIASLTANLRVRRAVRTVVNAVLAKALAGDATALKLVIERVLPRRVCSPVRDVVLPPLRTTSDAAQALEEITAAVLNGRLTAGEAASPASIVEVFIKVAASLDHECRIAELEDRAQGQQ
jgi:hypothetical protein